MNNDKENILKMADEFIQCLPGGFLVYRADEEEEIIAFNEEVLKIYGCGTDEEPAHGCVGGDPSRAGDPSEHP